MANVVHKAREDISKFPMPGIFPVILCTPSPSVAKYSVFATLYLLFLLCSALLTCVKNSLFKLTQMFIMFHATKMLSVYNAQCVLANIQVIKTISSGSRDHEGLCKLIQFLKVRSGRLDLPESGTIG